jgi:hypothetical protein
MNIKTDLTARQKVLVRGGSIADGCGVKTNYIVAANLDGIAGETDYF